MTDADPRSVAAVVADQFAALSPKQRAVAQLLVGDPAFVSFASSAEVAERAGVDAATVVRTCQALGYDGWRQMQEHVRSGFAERRTFVERTETLEARGDGDVVTAVFATALQNVAETLEDLDHEILDTIANRIVAAPQVMVAAGGVSEGPGLFLASSLQILGHRAITVVGAADAGAALGSVGDGDLVVAISVWRYLRPTIQILEAAHEAGVATAAITDSRLSPAARVADHALVAHTHTSGPRLGQAGIITLLEAVVTRVAALEPDRARDATARANRLYFDGNVLGDEGSAGTRRSGLLPPQSQG